MSYDGHMNRQLNDHNRALCDVHEIWHDSETCPQCDNEEQEAEEITARRNAKASEIRAYRKRMRMAEKLERISQGKNVFLTPSELIFTGGASDTFIQSEIEWRHRELLAGAREY
jgi:hypothetical protein